MATEKEPREPGPRQDRESPEALSLVDYFDQMDRAAFRRALEYRDSYFTIPSGSRVPRHSF